MRTVAVTGASAGIGRAVAARFAQAGDRVALIARSESALEDLRREIEANGGQAVGLACDVSDADAVETAAGNIEELYGEIDVWINCAMVTVFSDIETITAAEYRRVSDVTYHGTVYGSMAALRRMRPRNRGHIIQIGSALSYRSVPLQSAYCGAKHAIRGFSDSLRAELLHQKSAIEVSMIQLPAFNTPQFNWARNRMPRKPQPLPPIHQPALAAEAVYWCSQNPQREVWVGWPAWKAILGHKLLPGFLDRYVARTAWEGQFTDDSPDPGAPDNLFQPVEPLHAEEGPFSERSISKQPRLWLVRNHNFWINGAACCLLVAVFLLGLALG